MNTNFCIELSDDSAQNVSGGYYFGASSYTNVYANIYENLSINKNFNSRTNIFGNFAGGEAAATAVGPNTSTQAISSTNVVQGYGSASNATSISGTNGYYYYYA
jgi:hypothetical protein